MSSHFSILYGEAIISGPGMGSFAVHFGDHFAVPESFGGRDHLLACTELIIAKYNKNHGILIYFENRKGKNLNRQFFYVW